MSQSLTLTPLLFTGKVPRGLWAGARSRLHAGVGRSQHGALPESQSDDGRGRLQQRHAPPGDRDGQTTRRHHRRLVKEPVCVKDSAVGVSAGCCVVLHQERDWPAESHDTIIWCCLVVEFFILLSSNCELWTYKECDASSITFVSCSFCYVLFI